MSGLGHHSEWLSLIEISGPFLAEPVLKDAFPQGLEGLDSAQKTMVRQAYDEWREALDLDDPDFPKIHRAWVDLILKRILELDENDRGDVLKSTEKLPDTFRCELREHGISLRPDYAVMDGQADSRPLILITVYDPEVSLAESLKGDGWAANPAERMVELCRATNVRLGLVTNGEQWMLVDAPVGAVTTFASWYARHWGQEPATLQAFVSLLGIRRFFVDRSEQLPALLDNSMKFQDEVTDALGEQVRRAVEVLIQALDRADVDRNRELLDGIEPAELYEAGLTIMMRIVFLLSAEERGLLLLGDGRYEANYAVSTLRMQLRSESEEILERRWDAWSRLLSIFRAVYGGVDHEAMRLPALGGSLFDPDRFPFLEGRKKGSRWKIDPATPLPIDNRTVLYLLDAVQLFQGRTISYLALDVEQIGYVYEGLLERTVVRAEEATLDLDATKNAKNPWVSLAELDDAAAKGRQAVEELLEDRTGSSASRVRNDLHKTVDEESADKLLTACHADPSLRDRMRPYFHFLRTDRWGYPIVYPKRSFMVRTGGDRRETGTHYTPKSFTEAIVKETLEPLVYVGPIDGNAREDWTLKSPADLLNLKICDPAMGSGAFLVQVCRWLSERLVEAWARAEEGGKSITSDGEVVDAIGSREPLRKDVDERLLTARRLIAEQCLYGVDINPLAVELAKLSIWLITLAKGRPFGFLDHNLRSGDSLLGIKDLEQLDYLDLKPGEGSTKKLFASDIHQAVSAAIKLRSELRCRPIHDIRDVEMMARLNKEARRRLELPELIADTLMGEVLANGGKNPDTTTVSIEIGEAMAGRADKIDSLVHRAHKGLTIDLPVGKSPRRAFHWPLEFPEVFERDRPGFDSIVGNPPFLGGKKISGVFGDSYREYLVVHLAGSARGPADLIAYFFLRAATLCRTNSSFGLIASNTIAEGDTRDVGLRQILGRDRVIYHAIRSEIWPGAANVATSRVHIFSGIWHGPNSLDRKLVSHISASLTERANWAPVKLKSNVGIAYQGSVILGLGFTMPQDEAKTLIAQFPHFGNHVLFPYLAGKDLNSEFDHSTDRWVICFWDWSEQKAREYAPLFEKVLRDVKPERDQKDRKAYRERWWRFAELQAPVYRKTGRTENFQERTKTSKSSYIDKVLCLSTQASKYCCVSLVENKSIYANSLCVITNSSYPLFACLSSDIHAIWSFEHGSRLQERLRYSHGDVFETFPFPDGVLEDDHPALSEVGQQFFGKRRHYMIKHNKGMTKVYNDLHDPEQQNEEIQELRDLQARINDEVLAAYGFEEIDLQHGFHHVGYLPEEKNLRFTISEAAREELLHRLAKLNKSRSEEYTTSSSNSRTRRVRNQSKPETDALDGLFATGGGKA
jgi:hypothetical protein